MEILDTTYIHAANFILSLSAITILTTILYRTRKLKKSNFLMLMIVLPLIAMIHVCFFSLYLFVDHLDGVIANPLIINIWSIFVTMNLVTTIFWLSILAFIRHKKGGFRRE
jgi:hypothetical protein